MDEILQKPLAPLTSWHIGGNAERFVRPKSIAELAAYIQQLPETVPLSWLGLGSNVLIRDAGIKGAVISTLDLREIALHPSGEIWVEAGMPCAKFARFCCKNGYQDAAFFAGIPGTMGGALAMNAGAFGGETWEGVCAVRVLDRKGQLHVRSPEDYDIGYRHVFPKNPEQHQEAFVGAAFKFSKSDREGLEPIRALLRKRQAQQPIGTFNCGSVYRNPEGDYAARLIESCGLKGHRIGGAVISEKHANFIINVDNALAADVEQLMTLIESTVKNETGIVLHNEVRLLGEKEST